MWPSPFDFPGQGRNVAPMTGGLVDPNTRLRVLLKAMDEMGTFAGRLAGEGGAPGRYAVIGHSMASDIIVRHAQAHPEVQASVGVSLFAPSIRATTPPASPRNLLVVDGGLEPQTMATEALRVVGRVAGPTVAQGQSDGSFAAVRDSNAPVTHAQDVAEAVWRAVTDPAAPMRIAAGADSVALMGA